eukprot:COSAG01_NODE_140_length_24259_cov_41.225096_18_plen_163_part_00
MCVLVAGTHVLVIIPGFSQTGWVDNLNVGIALCKTLDMRGFKLPEDITVDANRFAYYNCFEDAQATAKRLFDPATKDVVPAGIKVGKTDPTSDPPKVHFGGTRCLLRMGTAGTAALPQLRWAGRGPPAPANRQPPRHHGYSYCTSVHATCYGYRYEYMLHVL